MIKVIDNSLLKYNLEQINQKTLFPVITCALRGLHLYPNTRHPFPGPSIILNILVESNGHGHVSILSDLTGGTRTDLNATAAGERK